MEIVARLHEILNMIKDFSASYSIKNGGYGYMLNQHKGKRYIVKITEIESLSENSVDDFVADLKDRGCTNIEITKDIEKVVVECIRRYNSGKINAR